MKNIDEELKQAEIAYRESLVQRDEVVKDLASIRTNYQERIDNFVKQVEFEFQNGNSELIELVAWKKEVATDFEELLRSLIVKRYEVTKEKTFGSLSVRVNTSLQYDEEKALEWAKKHQLALTLDKKAFEKYAQVEKFDFVTVVEKLTSVIGKEKK